MFVFKCEPDLQNRAAFSKRIWQTIMHSLMLFLAYFQEVLKGQAYLDRYA